MGVERGVRYGGGFEIWGRVEHGTGRMYLIHIETGGGESTKYDEERSDRGFATRVIANRAVTGNNDTEIWLATMPV